MSLNSSKSKARVCVVGMSGRMGARVVRLLADNSELILASGLEHKDAHLSMAVPAGVLLTADADAAIQASDVVIDFSAPAACTTIAPLCARLKRAYVCASTGLSQADEAALNAAAEHTQVLQAANLSYGVNVLLELVELAASRLGLSFDIEVSEIHHRFKRDAPSGTALALGKAAEQGRGGARHVHARAGLTSVRDAQEIGYAAMRGGDVSGDHTVHFFGEGERLELTHKSSTADIFAAGALRAAVWLVKQQPGRYAMRDVLTDAMSPR